MPEDLGPLAHEVIIAQGLALLADSVLSAVDEVFGFLVAVGLEDAIEEDVFVFDAGGFVFVLRGTECPVDGLEEASEPPVEAFVGFLNGTDGLGHELML